MIYVKGRCASFHWLLLRQYPLYNVACTSGRKYSRSKRPTLEARRVKSVFGVSILAPHQLRFFRSTVNFPAWTGAVLVTQGLFFTFSVLETCHNHFYRAYCSSVFCHENATNPYIDVGNVLPLNSCTQIVVHCESRSHAPLTVSASIYILVRRRGIVFLSLLDR